MSSEQLALTRATKIAQPSKATRQAVPAFLNKLYSMVNDPKTDELIHWSDEGDSFFVPNQERLGRELLPHFFKHAKFTTFVRQLNMYGFHKVPQLQQGTLKTETETELCQFINQNFKRGQPDLLCLIQRKKGPHGAAGVGAGLDAYEDGPETSAAGTGSSSTSAGQLALHSIASELAAIKRHQTTLSADLKELQMSNQALWQESLEAREKHKKHQDTINRILKFLAGVFGSSPGNEGNTGVGGGGSGGLQGGDAGRGVVPRKRPRLMIEPGSDHGGEKDGGGVVGDVEKVEEISDHDMVESDMEPLDIPNVEDDGYDGFGLSAGHISTTATSPTETTASITTQVHQSTATPQLDALPSSSVASPSNAANGRTSSDLLSALFAPDNSTTFSPDATSVSNTSFPPLPVSRVLPPSSSLGLSSSLDAVAPSSTVTPFSTDPNDPLYASTLASILNSPASFQRMMSFLPPQQLDALTTPSSSSNNFPLNYGFDYNNQLAPYNMSPTKNSNVSDALSLLPSNNYNPQFLNSLGSESDKLQRVYRSAADIESEVNGVQSSLDTLMESLGIEPSHLDTIVPPTLESSDSTNLDSSLDWEAFMNHFPEAEPMIDAVDQKNHGMDPAMDGAFVTEATPSTVRSEPNSPTIPFATLDSVLTPVSPGDQKPKVVDTRKRKNDTSLSPNNGDSFVHRTRRAPLPIKSPMGKKPKGKKGKV